MPGHLRSRKFNRESLSLFACRYCALFFLINDNNKKIIIDIQIPKNKPTQYTAIFYFKKCLYCNYIDWNEKTFQIIQIDEPYLNFSSSFQIRMGLANISIINIFSIRAKEDSCINIQYFGSCSICAL